MDKFKLGLDSSQVTQFLACPQKWYNYYGKKLRPVNFTQNENFNFGTYGHKLLEIYYKMKMRGCPKDTITEAINAYKPEGDVCECGCTQEYHIPVPLFNIQECHKCKRCTAFRPMDFILDPKLRGKVKVAVFLYIEKYKFEDDVVPFSEQTVEVGISEPFYEDDENQFYIEGRIDLYGVKKPENLECILDFKFQKTAHLLYNRSVQFKNYLLASGLNTLFIQYLRLHESKNADTLSREMLTMNSIQKEVWRRRLIEVYFRIKKQMLSKEFEKNWSECGGHAWGADKTKLQECWYTELCEEGDPQVRANKEKALYQIEERTWRPW